VNPFSPDVVRTAYDTAATDYTAKFGDDLDQLPLDREMLDRALAVTSGEGWIVEAGCGPAPAAGHFGARAQPMVAVDLSLGMLRVAGVRNPSLHRAAGDLLHLPLRDGSCRLVILYYVLHHLPRAQLRPALAEVWRVLGDDGAVVVATHLGERDVVIDELLGHRIEPMAGCLYDRRMVLDAVTSTAFRVDVVRERDPLPHEYDSRRLYLVAVRAT
jgi:ubiquinone/menaquinone biosynthesis C-methylase UbiE